MWGELSWGDFLLDKLYWTELSLGRGVLFPRREASFLVSETNLTEQLNNLTTAIAQVEPGLIKIMKTTANGPRLE